MDLYGAKIGNLANHRYCLISPPDNGAIDGSKLRFNKAIFVRCEM